MVQPMKVKHIRFLIILHDAIISNGCFYGDDA